MKDKQKKNAKQQEVKKKTSGSPKMLIYFVLPAILLVAWWMLASKTFNSKPDLNGDNFCYYTYATAMATGHGYADLSSPGNPPTANFPPGYPLLMLPLRLITDSIVAQKWLNEIFVLLGVILLFFTLIRLGLRWDISFAAAFAGLFCPRLWHFSTMMMSEASFFFTSALVFYSLARLLADKTDDSKKTWWSDVKNPWLWVMIAVLLLNYHIRTQGLALVAAIVLALLIARRWTALGTTVAGFLIGYLPYSLRNKALGLNGTRYIDTIMLANPFRPEEGTLTIGQVVDRFFDTLQMLVFHAIPNTVYPFLDLNCDQPSYTFSIYLVGALVLAVILVGFWSMGKLRWGMAAYLFATLGLISIFSTPSGNRYITSLLPILTAGLFCGLWQIILWLLKATKYKKELFSGAALLLCLLLFTPSNSIFGTKRVKVSDGIKYEQMQSKQKFPANYIDFFDIARELKASAPDDAVVCSRKPQMFWMYSNLPGVGFKWSSDTDEVMADLIEKKVDYVVLENLGYSQTGLYLFPTIQKYQRYFPIVSRRDNTHTYLLQFNREQAMAELNLTSSEQTDTAQ
ncbi:MAG: hypothetical protein IJR13_01760 [Bacteroidales bacterium]|nr:hypothetical protein [Bacteroidales bacterium]